MRLLPHQWFVAFWRNRGADQRAVLDQWSRLRELNLVLQDIALRGGAFQPLADHTGPVDAHQLAVNEGRRQLALEIIRTAGLDPLAMWRSIEAAQHNPQKETRT